MKLSKMNKYIIGAGLNGLIAAYYLKDYYLIDKKENIGGQFSNKFSLGPRFIHYNKKFEKLLKELKIRYSIKKVKVGYVYKNNMYNNLTKKMKEEYALKTRNSKDDKSFLSDKKRNFKYLDFNKKKFINKLFKSIKDRFINELVKEIDIKANTFTTSYYIKTKYDKLISTIHYNIFCKLSNIENDNENSDIYIYCCKKNKDDNGKFDYTYYIDEESPINRVTYYDNLMIIESIRCINPDRKIMGTQILKDYKLSKNKIKKFKNITFLGRYANLDNSKRISDVIKDIKNVK